MLFRSPLAKYCAPVLEFGKDLVSKIAKKPTHTIFETYKSKIRERLDEIETLVLDQIVSRFKTEVTNNTKEYFELFSKRLQQLKEKKSHGMSQNECENECKKLEEIVNQLQTIEKQLQKFGEKEILENTGNQMVQGLFHGIKGYLKKISQKD